LLCTLSEFSCIKHHRSLCSIQSLTMQIHNSTDSLSASSFSNLCVRYPVFVSHTHLGCLGCIHCRVAMIQCVDILIHCLGCITTQFNMKWSLNIDICYFLSIISRHYYTAQKAGVPQLTGRTIMQFSHICSSVMLWWRKPLQFLWRKCWPTPPHIPNFN